MCLCVCVRVRVCVCLNSILFFFCLSSLSSPPVKFFLPLMLLLLLLLLLLVLFSSSSPSFSLGHKSRSKCRLLPNQTLAYSAATFTEFRAISQTQKNALRLHFLLHLPPRFFKEFVKVDAIAAGCSTRPGFDGKSPQNFGLFYLKNIAVTVSVPRAGRSCDELIQFHGQDKPIIANECGSPSPSLKSKASRSLESEVFTGRTQGHNHSLLGASSRSHHSLTELFG